jgi:hypothetical protein
MMMPLVEGALVIPACNERFAVMPGLDRIWEAANSDIELRVVVDSESDSSVSSNVKTTASWFGQIRNPGHSSEMKGKSVLGIS